MKKSKFPMARSNLRVSLMDQGVDTAISQLPPASGCHSWAGTPATSSSHVSSPRSFPWLFPNSGLPRMARWWYSKNGKVNPPIGKVLELVYRYRCYPPAVFLFPPSSFTRRCTSPPTPFPPRSLLVSIFFPLSYRSSVNTLSTLTIPEISKIGP